jgi:putative copper export protein
MPSGETTLITALALLHWIATALYGGSLTAFAVLLSMRHRLSPLRPEDVMRTFRAWGAGLGLSMGALILSGLLIRFLQDGGFAWPADTDADVLRRAKAILFLVLWVSSFHLEIWTLEPCRKLDQGGVIQDAAAYEATSRRVNAQLWLNTALFWVIGALGLLAV